MWNMSGERKVSSALNEIRCLNEAFTRYGGSSLLNAALRCGAMLVRKFNCAAST